MSNHITKLQTDKPIQLFGDESYSQGMITYAFVIVPTIKLQNVEAEISRIKIEFGLAATDTIHCRKLFAYHQREKTAFKHLNKDEIFDFLQKLMDSLYLAGARGWIGYLNSNKVPDILLFEGGAQGKVDTWDVRDIKIKMLFAYQAAMGPLTHFVPWENVYVWVDGDTSKVSHIQGSRQMDSLRSFFPVEHNDKKLFPFAVHKNKPTILEIADVLAYSAAQGLSATYTKNKDKFISLVNAIKPGYSEAVFDNPNGGGAIMSARAHDRDDNIKTYMNLFIS